MLPCSRSSLSPISTPVVPACLFPLSCQQVLSLAPDVAPLYLLRVSLLAEAAGGRRTEEAMIDYATAVHLQPGIGQ